MKSLSDSQKSFMIALVTALVFAALGICSLLLGWTPYGVALFIALPIGMGIATGILPDVKWGYAGLALGAVIVICYLLGTGIEGFGCVIMALPIITTCVFLGTLIVYGLERLRQKKHKNTLNAFAVPLVLFLSANLIETTLPYQFPEVEVVSSRILDYTPLQVWDAVKKFEVMDSPQPWLFKLGLPVPYRCTLDREAVGGKRICYFRGGGRIEQEITVLDKPRLLRLKITYYDLTGRHWLHFTDAEYRFEALGQGTQITRITRYISELRPRNYWSVFEAMATQSEHAFVLDNLHEDLTQLDVQAAFHE